MKIIVIDDQRLFADGISELLKSYDANIVIDYVESVFLAREIIDEVNPPDLVLLSINDNALNNFNLISQFNQKNINIPVIIISTNNLSITAGLAIKNNAAGFITKSCSREIILEAILSVLDGRIYITKLTHYQQANETHILDDGKVTTRQKEILFLLSQGLLNKQIATELNISSNTVKAHLHNLFRHLQVTNRTAAVKLGYKNGLI